MDPSESPEIVEVITGKVAERQADETMEAEEISKLKYEIHMLKKELMKHERSKDTEEEAPQNIEIETFETYPVHIRPMAELIAGPNANWNTLKKDPRVSYYSFGDEVKPTSNREWHRGLSPDILHHLDSHSSKDSPIIVDTQPQSRSAQTRRQEVICSRVTASRPPTKAPSRRAPPKLPQYTGHPRDPKMKKPPKAPRCLVKVNKLAEIVTLVWYVSTGKDHAPLKRYEIFTFYYDDALTNSRQWKKISTVSASAQHNAKTALSCDFSDLKKNVRYFLTVRAVDKYERAGPFGNYVDAVLYCKI